MRCDVTYFIAYRVACKMAEIEVSVINQPSSQVKRQMQRETGLAGAGRRDEHQAAFFLHHLKR
jgi:hypothetical protein